MTNHKKNKTITITQKIKNIFFVELILEESKLEIYGKS